jgi:hypothetical protein
MFEAPILVSPFTTRDLSQEQLAECRSLNNPVRSGKSDIDIHLVCFRLISMRCFRRFPIFETDRKSSDRTVGTQTKQMPYYTWEDGRLQMVTTTCTSIHAGISKLRDQHRVSRRQDRAARMFTAQNRVEGRAAPPSESVHPPARFFLRARLTTEQAHAFRMALKRSSDAGSCNAAGTCSIRPLDRGE